MKLVSADGSDMQSLVCTDADVTQPCTDDCSYGTEADCTALTNAEDCTWTDNVGCGCRQQDQYFELRGKQPVGGDPPKRSLPLFLDQADNNRIKGPFSIDRDSGVITFTPNPVATLNFETINTINLD